MTDLEKLWNPSYSSVYGYDFQMSRKEVYLDYRKGKNKEDNRANYITARPKFIFSYIDENKKIVSIHLEKRYGYPRFAFRTKYKKTGEELIIDFKIETNNDTLFVDTNGYMYHSSQLEDEYSAQQIEQNIRTEYPFLRFDQIFCDYSYSKKYKEYDTNYSSKYNYNEYVCVRAKELKFFKYNDQTQAYFGIMICKNYYDDHSKSKEDVLIDPTSPIVFSKYHLGCHLFISENGYICNPDNYIQVSGVNFVNRMKKFSFL